MHRRISFQWGVQMYNVNQLRLADSNDAAAILEWFFAVQWGLELQYLDELGAYNIDSGV